MMRVVGHSEIREQLLRAARQNRLPHALLFEGLNGVGKKLVARWLAQWMLCPQPLETQGCGTCASCLQVEKNQHHALKIFEAEGAQFKIEDSRDVIKSLSLKQWQGPRFVVFDDADRLTPQAANALLKVVEEPPEHTYFILLTSRPGKILPTIKSRSQRVRFSPLTPAELTQITSSQGWVLASSGGSAARALELAETDRMELRKIAIEALAQVAQNASYLDVAEELHQKLRDKAEMQILLETWKQVLRDASLRRIKPPIHSDLQMLWRPLETFSFAVLDRMFQCVSRLQDELEANVDRHLILESGILQLQEVACPQI